MPTRRPSFTAGRSRHASFTPTGVRHLRFAFERSAHGRFDYETDPTFTVPGGNLDLLSGATLSEVGFGALVYCGTAYCRPSDSEDEVQFALPAGTVKRLYVRCYPAPGFGESFACTFRVDKADTLIAATISGNGRNAASNVSNTVTTTAGQAGSVKITPSSGAAWSYLTWTLEIDR
ncbi:hypothetical protein K2Z84_05340 [Candidatus Binatia bacterium]|nr:hypothetical protein [Candidatus Binatia bacterium]